MTSLSIIENKISSIKKYLKILEDYKDYSQKDIENDLTIRGAVERYLYLASQAVIDLAESVIAFKNFRKPTTMGENFDILTEEKVISKELAEKMIKLTGFRNIMAHDYEKVDYGIVYDILQNGLKDIEEFLLVIQSFLNLK